jgi:hypothetical protein
MHSRLKNEKKDTLHKAFRKVKSKFIDSQFLFNLPRSHFEATENEEGIYNPQIDDQVFFIYQGYEEVMSEYKNYFFAPDADNFEYIQDLYTVKKEKVLWKITNIEYALPTQDIFTLWYKYKVILFRFNKIEY